MALPKKHKVWVRWSYLGNEYITTTLGDDRSKYYMFRKSGDDYVQLGTNASPNKLEDKVREGKYDKIK